MRLTDRPRRPFYGVSGTPVGRLCACRPLRGPAGRQHRPFGLPPLPPFAASRSLGAFPVVRRSAVVIPTRPAV